MRHRFVVQYHEHLGGKGIALAMPPEDTAERTLHALASPWCPCLTRMACSPPQEIGELKEAVDMLNELDPENEVAERILLAASFGSPATLTAQGVRGSRYVTVIEGGRATFKVEP